MKATIHPTYHNDVEITCTSCGTSFVAGSTKEKITTEVCNHCHPLYTGEKRFIDTMGQVGKFKERQKIASEHVKTKKKNDKSDAPRPQSLRELLSKV